MLCFDCSKKSYFGSFSQIKNGKLVWTRHECITLNQVFSRLKYNTESSLLSEKPIWPDIMWTSYCYYHLAFGS